MTPAGWVRVESGHGRDRHTVYWNRPLPDGRRLTVARIYGDDGRLVRGGPWRWRVYAAPPSPRYRGPATVLAEGVASSVAAGRVAAEVAGGLRRGRRWVVLDYEGNPLPGDWQTEQEAIDEGLAGRYLLSGHDVVEVDR